MSDHMAYLLRFVEAYSGQDGVRVFKLLLGSDRELSYSDIIAETGLDEQTVRRVLYELNELGLVTYRRVQAPEGGRFIYYWSVNSVSINQALLNRKRLTLEKLRARLEYELSTVFFICPEDGLRLSFDEALEHDFRCPKCSSILIQEDRNPYLAPLRNLVEKLSSEIENERRAISS